jgi:exodeoxyribonuclease V alpha subunit
MQTSTFIGKVSKIYFSDEDSDFYIFQAEPLGSGRKVKVKGNFFKVRVIQGMEFKAEGVWESHPKYGSTFSVQKSDIYFQTLQGLERYLVNTLPSCTFSMAYSIVQEIGKGCIQTFAQKSDPFSELICLSEIEKQTLKDEWRSAQNYGNVADFLYSLGIPTGSIKNIYLMFGERALDVVKNNPYVLALADISFPLADSIAMKMGFSKDSSFRIASILEYLLEIADRQRGHLYLKRGDLLSLLNDLPSREKIVPFGRVLTVQDLEDAIQDRISECRIIQEKDFVYLYDNYEKETKSAKMLAELLCSQSLGVDIESFVKDYERIHKIELSDEQAKALRLLNEHKVVLITGHPGTGKTLTTKAIVSLLEKLKKSFLLLSPTGIAAKRLSSVTGRPASTIHRALGYKDGSWSYDSSNPLGYDAFILDETSMLDMDLFYRVLEAIPKTSMLVLVGDPAQLPSVGAGNVLHDLIHSNSIPRAHLHKIFRQESASDIILNAHRINSGEEPSVSNPLDKTTDFKFFQQDTADVIQRSILSSVKKLFSSENPPTFQVLSPTYKGPLGVNKLNSLIKEALNPPSPSKVEVSFGIKSFREEDRVMVVENDYTLGVFNGEVGKIYFIDNKKKIIRVKLFDEGSSSKIIDIPFSKAKTMLILSYAVTVHKCVHPETFVDTPEGLKRIGDLESEGYIATPNGYKKYTNKVVNPPRKGLNISISGGPDLKVTPDHCLDVWVQERYTKVKASDIIKGDFLRVKINKSDFSDNAEYVKLPPPPDGLKAPEKLDEKMALFLGLVDGPNAIKVTGSKVTIRSTHLDVLNLAISMFEELFGIEAFIDENNPTDIVVDNEDFRNWIDPFTRGKGHGTTSRFILESPVSCQKAYLKGVFNSAIVHRGLCPMVLMLPTFTLTNFQPIYHMLLRLGIMPAYRGWNNIYQLMIQGREVAKFNEVIGCLNPFVEAKLPLCLKEKSYGVVPLSPSEIENLRGILVGTFMSARFFRYAVQNNLIQRDILERVLEKLKKNGLTISWIEDKLSYQHLKVYEVTEDTFPTVCVEVPDGNQFLQNGYSGWNCQGQEFDYVIFPFHKTFGIQLQRNLLYTAITRAKNRVYIFGQWAALLKASSNNEVSKRNTNLADRLVKELQGFT